MNENTKFYKAVCMCGHVGRNNYIPIAFAVKATDGKEAAKIARDLPRVKHHKKYAVLSCDEINEEQYEELRRINDSDPYLSCKNIQEQREHPEIIQRAIRMEGTHKRMHNHKEGYSKKYSNWKRIGRYNIIDVREEENEFYSEMEDELILVEVL